MDADLMDANILNANPILGLQTMIMQNVNTLLGVFSNPHNGHTYDTVPQFEKKIT